MALTAIAVKQAKSTEKQYKLLDGRSASGGLDTYEH
jgi:hypothetical protein